jgi:hypothetical protein
MFMIYFHIKYHLPSSNSSSVTANKLKAEENVHTAAMLLYYVNKGKGKGKAFPVTGYEGP